MSSEEVPRTNVSELLQRSEITKICAPMVRYSRQPFRLLVRKYNCDLAYTPMIISNSFVRAEQCREIEFQPHSSDRPLVVQFAASNAVDFASAAEIVYPHADGVGLNCGCPQRWAMAEGYGAKLIQQPELVKDIIRSTRNKISDNDFSVSVKIRIHRKTEDTVDMCQKFESAGASYISVHCRTTKERNQPPHYDVIRAIKDSVNVPVVVNGGIKTPDDITRVAEMTGLYFITLFNNNPNKTADYSKRVQT